MKCPICNSDSQRLFEVKKYWICDCLSCSHRFTELNPENDHVKKIYDDSYFNGGGAGYTNYLAESEILRRRGHWYSKLLSKYTKKGKVLDVGSAAGFVLKGMTETGWKGVGVEPNAKMAEYGRKKLGLEILTTSVENYSSDEKFDAVTMIQVMAHFARPKEIFSHINQTLKNNGHLLIETWNRKSLSEKIFGTKWHEYSPPSVLHFFSDEGIENLAKQHGYKRIAAGRPSKWISGSHAKSLIAYKFGERSIITKLFSLIPNRMNFPYPAEDLFWVLYQKK
ncbi:MAG: class I SAM-dependent methyltransferase [Acidobacteria bacterium]|nr:class I SAM-dependent methyltransferase [Acidobacteriota bacterium]